MIDRMMKRYSDPDRRSRLVKWLWIISTGFTLFGFAVILYLLIA